MQENYLLTINLIFMTTSKFKTPALFLSILTAGFFSFRAADTGSVKGTVNPPDGAVRAWALSATDTFKTTISGGTFEIKGAKAGTYRIIIEAAKPYKNTAREDVVVTDGAPVDLGVIELVKDSTGVQK